MSRLGNGEYIVAGWGMGSISWQVGEWGVYRGRLGNGEYIVAGWGMGVSALGKKFFLPLYTKQSTIGLHT
jgi:hypothetical protein